MKKILACTLASLLVPSICLAHSGTLLRAFANYLPFLAPILAGLVGGIGIGALNLIALTRLLTGRMPDDELVVGAESEELTAFENQQAAEKR